MPYPIIERAITRVGYTSFVGDPFLSDAFQRLEQLVPLKGNRFFATFDAATREYRACVALKPGQTAAQLGLPEGILPGGRYGRGKLSGPFAEIVRRIAPTLAQMRQHHAPDPARLPIEYYRRHTEIVLYLPIASWSNP